MRKHRFLSLLSIFALVGCGGGGGKSMDTSTWSEAQIAAYSHETKNDSEYSVDIFYGYSADSVAFVNTRGPKTGENFIRLWTAKISCSAFDRLYFRAVENNEQKTLYPIPDLDYDYGYNDQNNIKLEITENDIIYTTRAGVVSADLLLIQYDYFYMVYLEGFTAGGGTPYSTSGEQNIPIPTEGFPGTTPKHPGEPGPDPDPGDGGTIDGEPFPPEGGIPNWPRSSSKHYSSRREVVTYTISCTEQCILSTAQDTYQDKDTTESDSEGYYPMTYDYVALLWGFETWVVGDKEPLSETYSLNNGALKIVATYPVANHYNDDGEEMRVILDFTKIENHYDADGFLVKRYREWNDHDFCFIHNTFCDLYITETTTYTYE